MAEVNVSLKSLLSTPHFDLNLADAEVNATSSVELIGSTRESSDETANLTLEMSIHSSRHLQ